jgi:hypothetical protein
LRTAAYRRKQEIDFSAMLRKHGGGDAVRAAARSEQAARPSLPQRPHVLVLGHLSWERYGLWPSLNRLADTHMIEVGRHEGGWSEPDRRELTAKVQRTIVDATGSRAFDLVFIYCDSCFIDPQLILWLRGRNVWTVMMALDDQHKFVPRREYGMRIGQALVAPLVDVYWTTWRVAAAAVHAAGGTAVVAAPGADPHFHKPLAGERDIDVLFLGARYGAREGLVTFLRTHHINVQAFGRGWENGFVTFDESVALISRSRVVLGVGTVGHSDAVFHLKGRDFEVPMCGAAYVTSYHPELCNWFHVGTEILCYSSPLNCAELLASLLHDDERLEIIRTAVLARSLRDHTWEARFRSLFEKVRSLPSSTDRNVA